MPATRNPALLDRNARRIYGCSHAAAVELNSGAPLRARDSAAHRYATQRTAAHVRGIAWQFDFAEWLGVWRQSGQWGARGVGVGHYCMARRGDTGPYSPGNVVIALCTDNSREGLLTRFKKD